ncbi:sulfite exporter TauE/SafE family protein [Lentilactobacillus hilgardii]|uniref:sulfite exporter TauE/SafE family protein n=1 Tax=Lentilactobacillus hilgardii TaxID=1588 RepID=UPI0021A55953|nr:sulfite exporter TauE/SafE family protein [Lentilactobacillus hilgardii]MCT3400827.1 sulfite exporter TauE/SafE family protein [Lentilactobacillus hilgardii]
MILFLVVLIALFGALVRTVFGFGEALVTMPLLALISFDLNTSVALIGALGLIVALPGAIRYRVHINVAIVRRLVIGSILGVPVGIFLIKYVDKTIIMRILSVFLMVYGSYCLIRIYRQKTNKPRFQSLFFDYVAGVISGVMGSAYNSHGVPIVVYGTLKKLPVMELRGILQAHFLCVGILVVASQAIAGFWSMEVFELLAIVTPLLFLVIPFGNWLTDHIDNALMIKYVYGLLIVFGMMLFIKS